TRAISLYHRHGFREIGVRRNYYALGSGREDALTMRLELER
ncbi:MAG: ribosomal-protein-alanine N-acetyltransferase, partial [Proteobacteria bacterium]